MMSLLPSNARPLERALESVTERAFDLPLNFSDVWHPDKCPAHMLQALAWAMSVDTWNNTWPETVKRQHIRQAIAVHRLKGTAYAVKQVVRAFGADITIKEWFEQEPKGPPHTFEIQLSGGYSKDKDFQADIIEAIKAVKPLRSHFTLTAGLAATGGFTASAQARVVQYVRLNAKEAQHEH